MSLKPIKLFIEGERLLEEALQSTNSLEESLMNGNMSSFLNEEAAGDEALQVLSKAIQEAQAELEAFGTAVKAVEGMDATMAALGAANKAFSDIALDPGKESLKLYVEPIEKAKKALADVSALQGIVANAALVTQTALGKLMDEAGKEMPIGEWLDSKAEDTAIPDRDKFKAGVKKAWKPPAGIMNALKDFAAGLFGGGGADYFGLTFDAFTEDLMKVKYSQFEAFAQSGEVQDAGKADETEKIEQELGDKISDETLKAIEKGETPKSSAGEKSKGGDIKKWSELAKAYLGSVEDKAVGQKYLDALKVDKKFTDAASGLVNLEESLFTRSLLGLLAEEIEFDILKAPAAKVAKEEEAQVQLATGLAKVLSDQGVNVKNVPAEETSGEEQKPAGEKEAAKEQDNADAQLQAAAKEEAGEAQTPASAVLGAIDGWYDGLSDTSKKSMQAKNRLGGLKDALQGSLDNLSKVVEKEVSKAIGNWRKEHEETLTKSKRFAKKNFDQLQTLIPQLASTMLKKSNESNTRLTRSAIHKSVYKFLDKQFRHTDGNLLTEELLTSDRRQEYSETDYTESDMVKYRWMKMAGLGRYN